MIREKITKAAKLFAMNELGDDQFKSNTDAVQAISESFSQGSAYIIQLILLKAGCWVVSSGIGFAKGISINATTLDDGIYFEGEDIYVGTGFNGKALFKLK